MSSLRNEILKLFQPNVVWIDSMKVDLDSYEQYARFNSKAWSPENDVHLRIIFLKFFASILGGYRNFIENTANQVFNTQAFLKKHSRATQQPIDEMVATNTEKVAVDLWTNQAMGILIEFHKYYKEAVKNQQPLQILRALQECVEWRLSNEQVVATGQALIAGKVGENYFHYRARSS